MRDIAIELRDVAYGFPGAPRETLRELTLAIASGEFVTFVGPSGCGKSTLLRLIAGLLAPTSGTLSASSTAVQGARSVGFVFQHPTLLPWRTAIDNVRLPLELGREQRQVRDDAALCALLEQVGLQRADAGKRPFELSGGMQMRLSLARALVTEPALLLLDEPFAAVDDLLRQKLQDDLRRIHEQRALTTVLVTHNLSEAVFLSDRVVILSGSPATIQAEAAIEATSQRSAGFRSSHSFADAVRRLAGLLNAPPAIGAHSSIGQSG